jgi:hypothetical protein
MTCTLRRLALAFLLAALLLPLSASVALAHGRTTVGDYTLIIGFREEPAFQSEANALDLLVTNTKTSEKINGLADSLKAEIGFGSAKQELKLRPQVGRDGAYTAYVVPSVPGNYTWHIFGSIKGTPVDISMTSSPTTFSAITSKNELSFPSAEISPATLQAQAAATAQLAQRALFVAFIGTALGIAGIAVGLLGWRARGARPERRAEVSAARAKP